MLHTVGILEMKVSSAAEDVLFTHSLGSCIGLSLYDPEQHIGGLAHCMLPYSEIDPACARRHPCMFVDTAVPLLIRAILDMGAEKQRLVAKAAGAARLLDAGNLFSIGDRNLMALRQVMREQNMPLAAEDMGGTMARSMALHLDTGAVMIKTCGRLYELGQSGNDA